MWGDFLELPPSFDRYDPHDTPIKGLYLVGEEVFAGQGWPGVIMGVRNGEGFSCTSDLTVRPYDWGVVVIIGTLLSSLMAILMALTTKTAWMTSVILG